MLMVMVVVAVWVSGIVYVVVGVVNGCVVGFVERVSSTMVVG